MNIWAFQWCRNSPPMAPHLHNHTHAHHTPNTPSHTQTFSWALQAAPQLKPLLPFLVPEDSRSFGVNIGLLTMTILHLLKDAESPVCNCWGLLLPSSNWSNSGVGNFVYTDSRCNRYKTLSNSIPANMVAKLYHLCIPATGIGPQYPSSGHGMQLRSTYASQSTPVFKDSQREKCLPVQNNLLVTMEILPK